MQPEPNHARPVPTQRVETDPDRSHRRALERGDEVVQQLAVAKYALSVGDLPLALDAIDAALSFARDTLTTLLDLLSPPADGSHAGALVRSKPADGAADS